MPLDPKSISEYLFTQGILGIAVVVLLSALVYLWRDAKAQRKAHDEELNAERLRHAVEIAAERKLNSELQEARLRELKTVLEAAKDLSNSFDAVVETLRMRAT